MSRTGSIALLALLPPLLLASCASYRYRSLPASDGPSTAAPLGYESTRALLFHGEGDDALVERVFASRDGAVLLVTVLWPAAGVLASSDLGATWSFTALPLDDRLTPRVLREVLFDPADANRIYARAFNGLLVSDDGGRSWSRRQVGERRSGACDALALGADGTLYAAHGDALYASDDRGETLHLLPLVIPAAMAAPAKDAAEDAKPDPVRIRSLVADPAQPKTLYVSVEQEPPAENFQRRLIGLLDQTTDEGAKARAMLKLPADKPLDRVAFGDPRAGLWLTHDGGRSWQKSGLGVDSWLVAGEGAVYAVAAEPLLLAAGLAARSPELAGAIGAQLHENGFDPELLRRACAFPGRERLLAAPPPAAIFRSVDQGSSWSRVVEPPLPLALALRRSIDAQRLGKDPWAPRPVKRGPEQHDLSTDIGPDQPNGSRRPVRRNRPPPRDEPVAPPDLTEPLLSLLEPAGLLSHLGPDLPLTGLGSGDALWAWAPTAAYWSQLTEALVRATRRQGELSLGSTREAPADGPGFELLLSSDGGLSWRPFAPNVDRYGVLAARGIAPFPAAAAASGGEALFLLSGRDKQSQLWRELLRQRLTPASAP